MTAHTFLFEPARWQINGIFVDPAGLTLPMTGHTIVLHGEGIWSLTGKIHLTGEATVEIVNDYRIVPFQPGESQTTWTSHNSAPSRGDSFLSTTPSFPPSRVTTIFSAGQSGCAGSTRKITRTAASSSKGSDCFRHGRPICGARNS